MPERRRRVRAWAANWGATPGEIAAPLPCDPLLPDAALVVHRAVTVRADAPLVYRWVCQLRAAPYSYDLVDNFARRSPQRLTPGLERLERGQRVMTLFRLDSFVHGDHLTLVHRTRAMGRLAVTYATRPCDGEPGATRLLARYRWTRRRRRCCASRSSPRGASATSRWRAASC